MNPNHLSKKERNTAALAAGLKTHGKFEELVDEVANTRLEKVMSYGEKRYTTEDPKVAMTLVYGDLSRKWIRIENAMLKGELTLEDGETLREAFKDLAAYGVMGMQEFDRLYPEGVPAKVEQPKLDQIAFYTNAPESYKQILSEIFGRELTWHNDIVHGEGKVFGKPAQNYGHLSFNYDLCNTEFEVISYKTPGGAHDPHHYNWLEEQSVPSPSLAHIGMHVEDLDYWVERIMAMGGEIAQYISTISHTNPNIAGKRLYTYVIFDTREMLGFDLKLIKRHVLDSPQGMEPTEQMQVQGQLEGTVDDIEAPFSYMDSLPPSQ